jgi:hypothetical protein
VLIAVGVRLSSGAVCTKGSTTSIWVGVPVIGMDIGGDVELVTWHPPMISHKMNKKIVAFFSCRLCLE